MEKILMDLGIIESKADSCMVVAKEKYDATCYLWGSMFLLFDLIYMTYIFCMMQRGVVKLQFVIQIKISWKTEF